MSARDFIKAIDLAMFIHDEKDTDGIRPSEILISAGPDGGTEDTPVGTVYIGCSVKGKITVQKYIFSGNRAKIRENAVAHALILLRRCVLEYFSEVTFGSES